MCIGHIIIQSQAQPVTVLTGDSEAFQEVTAFSNINL